MFVINFSPNAVIPSVALAQLSVLSWELSSWGRKGGVGCGFRTNLGSSHPVNVTFCGLHLRCHLLWGSLFLPPPLDLCLQITLCHFLNLHLLRSIDTCILSKPSEVPSPIPGAGLGLSDSQ